MKGCIKQLGMCGMQGQRPYFFPLTIVTLQYIVTWWCAERTSAEKSGGSHHLLRHWSSSSRDSTGLCQRCARRISCYRQGWTWWSFGYFSTWWSYGFSSTFEPWKRPQILSEYLHLGGAEESFKLPLGYNPDPSCSPFWLLHLSKCRPAPNWVLCFLLLN